MKIVHVITCLGDGGAEGALYRLCKHSRENDHIVISLSDEGKYGKLLRTESIKVFALNMRTNLPSPFAFFNLVKLIKIHEPDIVQTWMYHADFLGSIAAYILRIKTIIWGIRHTTLNPNYTKKSTIFIAKLLSRMSSWLPAYIVVNSEKAINQHEIYGYDRTKMHFIPNGYNLSQFTSNKDEARDLREELRVAPDIALIGTVGRYHPEKNHANLLSAIKILCTRGISVMCLFVGKNLDKNNTALVEKIKILGIENSVILLGQRSDIPAVMNALDLFVLPSSGEAFPNVVAEAMACETPCVVTDVGDAAKIVGDTGWVVPSNDAKALAASIQQALNVKKQKQWRGICVSARTHILNNYSIDKMVMSYHKLWDKTLSNFINKNSKKI